MNLAGFKKTAENKKTVTMTHANGHEIKIAKSALSHIQRKQIERLPMNLADGTDDGPLSQPEDDTQTQSPASPASYGIKLQDQDTSGGLLNNDPSILQKYIDAPSAPLDAEGQALADRDAAEKGTPSPLNPVVETAQGNPPTPASTPNQPDQSQPQGQKPAADSSGAGNVQGYYNAAQAALKSNADIAGRLATSRQEIDQNQILATQAFQADNAQNLATIKQQNEAFAQHIADNPIDPKHYVENLSSGQKVANAIGLILGGFQGGFNKTGVNPAAEFLNKQIDRDIAAQQAQGEQAKTVLNANRALYGDEVAANNNAKVNMMQIYGLQAQQAAEKDGGLLAKNNAAALQLDLAAKSAPLLQQAAIRQSVNNALKTGGSGITPALLGQAGRISPEEATKEQASYDKQQQSIATVNEIFDQYRKEDTAGNYLNPFSYARTQALAARLTPLIQSEDPSKRLNPETLALQLKPFLPITRNTPDPGVIAAQQQGVLDLVKQAHAGEMPLTGQIAPGALPQYPNVANGPNFKTSGGVQYQKVPGGYKKVK